jgi:hypothetical protein
MFSNYFGKGHERDKKFSFFKKRIKMKKKKKKNKKKDKNRKSLIKLNSIKLESIGSLQTLNSLPHSLQRDP